MEDTGERLIPEGHTKTLTYGEHLSRYLSVLSVTKQKVVLDIASGAGYGTKLISKTAKQVYGIDYSEEAIEYAKKNYGAKNITYKVGDAHEIPLPDDSVDVVVSLETIEHLKKPATFVQEVKRILKKDGIFIVSTPNDDEFIEGNEFHLHEFDLKELQKLIQKNFKKSEFYYQGTYFSSAILTGKTFSEGGDFEGSISKTFGQPHNKAIYFLAIASDGTLEKLQENVALADAWSTKDDLETDKARQTHVGKIQKELDGMREHAALLEKQKAIIEEESRGYQNELIRIRSSVSWRVLAKARSAVRRLKK